MSRLPAQFERATGVVEQVRQCLQKGCRRMFRTANDHETACPYCGSAATFDIRQGRPAGSNPARRNFQ